MNSDKKYTQYALAREMMETTDIIRNFKLKDADKVISAITAAKKLFFTGEGSSRIFPAKNAIYCAMRSGMDIALGTEGGRQAGAYDLRQYAVFGASNSGRTKEVIWLFDRLKKINHDKLFGLTANENTPLEKLTEKSFVLSCGGEDAVAATKSVMEQALFYQAMLTRVDNRDMSPKLEQIALAVEQAMTMQVPAEMTDAIANAGTIYFAGKNDGVAEELTLKTNEITRKKSDYLEGTYLVHGVEEVMNPDDVVILIDPFTAELEKIKETLVEGVGLKVFAIADEDTIFPTMKIPYVQEVSNYAFLAAGWNILVEVGIKLGIDLDKPQRARKVGNEFTG